MSRADQHDVSTEADRSPVAPAPYYHRDLEPYELSRREAALIVAIAVMAVVVVSAVVGTAGFFAWQRFFA